MEEEAGKVPPGDIPEFGKRHFERDRIYGEIRKESSEDLAKAALQFRDTVRNLSLACGAVAAAGLASLGIQTEKNELFVLSGSLLLMMLGAISFCYLLHAHWKESKSIVKARNEALTPFEGILNDAERLILRHEITLEEFLEREKKFIEEGVAEYVERNSRKDFTEDNTELFFLAALVTGVVLIVVGFLQPYFNDIWSIVSSLS